MKKSLKESAAKIVNQLLEDAPIRACVMCEKEHGVYRANDTAKSHGLCRRHMIQWASEQGLPKKSLDSVIAKAKSDSDFPPDLGPV